MSLETILAELPELAEEERKIVRDMIDDLSNDSSCPRSGQQGSAPTLLPGDYWTKIFAGWNDKQEEDLPEDFSLNYGHYIHGVPKEW